MPEVDPAIAALALWCVHRDHEPPTHTQGETIFYGPEFPLLTPPEQVGLLAHHVLHVALRHSARQGQLAERLGASFDAHLYGLVSDGLINEALLAGGHALPRPFVRAEDLVALLPKADRPGAVLAEMDSERLYFAIAAIRRAQTGQGGESGPQAAKAYGAGKGFAPDVLAQGRASAPDREGGADVWAGRVRQAMAQGRAAGAGIGAALATFGELPQARVPWELQLRRLLLKATADIPRRTHARPDRAWLAQEAWARRSGGPSPAFQPGVLRNGRRARVIIGLDTSSSVTQAQLGLFASEALSIARKSQAEITLLGFDTEVHTRARLDRAALLTSFEMRRDGGTDFNGVLEEANACDPSLIVMLTDLDARLGPPPRAPVIWAVPEAPSTPPRFGEVLEMTG